MEEVWHSSGHPLSLNLLFIGAKERLATQRLSRLGGMLFFDNRSNLSFWAVLVFIVVISWALEAWAFKSSISVGFRTLR